MTTVAWDGQTLAADVQLSVDGTPAETRKMWPASGGGFYAGAGDLENILLAVEWLNAPNRAAIPKPVIDRANSIALLHVYAHGSELICNEYGVALIPIRIHSPFYAIGSGRASALAAMHCKRDAVSAVQIAAKFDIWTSSKCTSVTLTQPDPDLRIRVHHE